MKLNRQTVTRLEQDAIRRDGRATVEKVTVTDVGRLTDDATRRVVTVEVEGNAEPQWLVYYLVGGGRHTICIGAGREFARDFESFIVRY